MVGNAEATSQGRNVVEKLLIWHEHIYSEIMSKGGATPDEDGWQEVSSCFLIS